MSDAASSLLGGMDQLKSYVRKRMRDPGAVEDVVQEALARVMEQQRRQVIEHPLAYAYRVADSVILATRRKADRASELAPLAFVCEMPLADEMLDYRQRYSRFETALLRLPPLRRTVFHMRHIDGKSRQEIADELDLSLEAVKKHLARAMAELARVLEGDLDFAGEGKAKNV